MDYDVSRATALRLIEKFGKEETCTIYRAVSSGYNPLTGSETVTETGYTISVVIVPQPSRIVMQVMAAGVVDYDVLFAVPASGLSIVPKPGDTVALPGYDTRLAIVGPVDRIAPDGDDIVFFCMAKATNP